MSLIIIENISNSLVEYQAGDLRDEGATGAGFWLVDESADQKHWKLLARFTDRESAEHFANNYSAALILEE